MEGDSNMIIKKMFTEPKKKNRKKADRKGIS